MKNNFCHVCRSYDGIWCYSIAEWSDSWITLSKTVHDSNPVLFKITVSGCSWEAVDFRVEGNVNGFAGIWEHNDPLTVSVRGVCLRPVRGAE